MRPWNIRCFHRSGLASCLRAVRTDLKADRRKTGLQCSGVLMIATRLSHPLLDVFSLFRWLWFDQLRIPDGNEEAR